ncbi:MAG: ketoacyl-ACP synthase III [Ruminococcus sp.]|jgi:3-oxoacyl-[acyl-carrier-protein] synthase-3|nr:ketoacyl-ACP synthase III [Ruminococcus sp.]
MKIVGTGSAIPKFVLTNDMMAELVDTSDEWIVSRTGIRERHVATEESLRELAGQAAKNAIENSGLDISQIGTVICATCSYDMVSPSLACMLSKDLGMEERTLTFDLNSACSGFAYALYVASRLCEDGKYVLVMAGERLSRFIDYTERSTCVLLGDGAGAVVVGKEGEPFTFLPGARGDDKLIHIPAPKNGNCPFYEEEDRHPYFHMEGQEVFKFATRVVPQSIKQVLSERGWELSEVDWFLFHQANYRIIEKAARDMGVPLEKFFINVDKYGNTSAASLAIALDELNKSGGLKRGQKVAIAGFGGGLTYGAGTLVW